MARYSWIAVLMILNIIMPSVISIGIGPSDPAYLSEEWLENYDQRIYFPIELDGYVSVDSVLSCENHENIRNYRLMRIGNDTNPYMLVVVNKGVTQSFVITCELEYYKGNFIQSEILELNIQIGDPKLQTLKKSLGERIADEQDSMMANAEWITKMHELFENLKHICELFGTISKISDTLNKIKPLVYTISKATSWMGGDALYDGYCELVQSYDDNIRDRFWDSEFGKIMKKACYIVNCKQCNAIQGKDQEPVDLQQQCTPAPGCTTQPVDEATISDFDDGQTVTGNERGEDFRNFFTEYSFAEDAGFSSQYSLNPENSIVYSAACLCLPGVIKHLHEYRQIQCRYIQCLQMQAESGMIDIGYCEELKSVETCEKVVGETFTLFPWTNIISNMLNQVRSLIQTAPLALSGALLDKLLKESTLYNDIKDVLKKCDDAGEQVKTCEAGDQVFSIVCGIASSLSHLSDYKDLWGDPVAYFIPPAPEVEDACS